MHLDVPGRRGSASSSSYFIANAREQRRSQQYLILNPARSSLAGALSSSTGSTRAAQQPTRIQRPDRRRRHALLSLNLRHLCDVVAFPPLQGLRAARLDVPGRHGGAPRRREAAGGAPAGQGRHGQGASRAGGRARGARACAGAVGRRASGGAAVVLRAGAPAFATC